MTERDLIRRLENAPVPPPPEDLAARIINDIPAEVELHPGLEHEEHRRRFGNRSVWMAAAAAVTIALTGAVTWELRKEQPSIEYVLAARDKGEVSEADLVAEEEGGGKKGRGDDSFREESTLELKNDHNTVLLEPESAEKSAQAPTAAGVVGGAVRPQPHREILADPMPAGPLGEGSRGRTNEPMLQVLSDDLRSRVKFEEQRSEIPNVAPSTALKARRVESVDGLDETPPKTTLEAEKRVEREMVIAANPEMGQKLGSVGLPEAMMPKEHLPTKKSKGVDSRLQPSTGGAAEPNDQPYGDVFFEHTGVNPFVDSEDDSLSTFGLDVDTGSFTIARRYLRDGHMPPRAAIRVEEFVNAFDYGDASPRKEDFRLVMEGAPSAFAAGERTYALRLAVKARDVDAVDRPSAVLVFCVDVSGSMDRENRLELVKKSLHELLGSLRRDDYVGLVVYGSNGQVLLRPTTDHDTIRAAVERLQAGGSTNAEEGLVLAYDLLGDGDKDERIRRVILCSDGVANVGRTGPNTILERIRREASGGIELTTVGFGMGNYNDTLMEQLADTGNGRYAYVDALPEARRIFVEELTGTLMTLGHDAKAQVEFDPEVVSRWRLLGYENRDIADHLFRDPSVDAGEIGAGHTVTAVYEIKLRPKVGRWDRVATLRLRYRPIGQTKERELEETLRVSQLADTWEDASPALRLATTVAEFAEILKGAYWAKDGSLDDVQRRLHTLDEGCEDRDRFDSLVEMVGNARALRQP